MKVGYQQPISKWCDGQKTWPIAHQWREHVQFLMDTRSTMGNLAKQQHGTRCMVQHEARRVPNGGRPQGGMPIWQVMGTDDQECRSSLLGDAYQDSFRRAVRDANETTQSQLLGVRVRFSENGLCRPVFSSLHLRPPVGSAFGTRSEGVGNLLPTLTWTFIDHMHQQQLRSRCNQRSQLLQQLWTALQSDTAHNHHIHHSGFLP